MKRFQANKIQEGYSSSLLDRITESKYSGVISFSPLKNGKGELIDFKPVYINEVACDLLKTNYSDFINKNLRHMEQISNKDEIFRMLTDVLHKGVATYSGLSLKGENRLQLFASKIDDDTILVSVSDPEEEERKLFNKKPAVLESSSLENCNYFINKFTSIIPGIVSLRDVQFGSILYMNQMIEQVTGFPTHKFLNGGLNFYISLIHPDDVSHFIQQHTLILNSTTETPTFEDRNITEFEYRIWTANSGYKWLHTFDVIYHRNEDSRVSQILSMSIDISSRKGIDEGDRFIRREIDEKNRLLHLENLLAMARG